MNKKPVDKSKADHTEAQDKAVAEEVTAVEQGLKKTANSSVADAPKQGNKGQVKPSSKNLPLKKSIWFYLSVFSIPCLLALVFFLSYFTWQARNDQRVQTQQLNQLELQQQQLNQKLEQGLVKLKAQQKQALDTVQANTAQQSEYLALFDDSAKQLSEQVNGLETRLAQFALRSPEDWLFYEANYLVQLAGFKLYLKRDFSTASALLSSADERLLQLADPSLMRLRSALAKDIAAINALPDLDLTGLALALNSLLDQVDNLNITSEVLGSRPELQKTALTESIDDWQANLHKSWISFRDNFVRVQHRDTAIEPLLAPNEQWFLYQNVKTKLLQAQTALYREQTALYQEPLKQAQHWVLKYFSDDSTRQFVLTEISRLQSKAVQVELPAQLLSPKLFKQEVKRISTPDKRLKKPSNQKVKPSPKKTKGET